MVVYTKNQRFSGRVHKFHDCRHDEKSRNGSWYLVSGLSSHWIEGYGTYKYYVQKGVKEYSGPTQKIDAVFRRNLQLPNSIVSKVHFTRKVSSENVGSKNYKKMDKL